MISNRLSLTTSITTTRIVIHVIIPPFGTIKQVVRTSIRMQFIMESQYININRTFSEALTFCGSRLRYYYIAWFLFAKHLLFNINFYRIQNRNRWIPGLMHGFLFSHTQKCNFQPPISEIHFCVKVFSFRLYFCNRKINEASKKQQYEGKGNFYYSVVPLSYDADDGAEYHR